MPGRGKKRDPKDPSGFDDGHKYKPCRWANERGWCWHPKHLVHRKVNGAWYYRL